MTAVKLFSALKYAVLHVGQLKGLPFWRRFQIALLQIVSICAYNYGKIVLARETGTNFLNDEESIVNGSEEAEERTLRTRTAAALKIAVIIPVYVCNIEEYGQVFVALLQLSKQERMQDLLILVDDASPLPLPYIISTGKVVVLRHGRNQGPGAARNTGLQKAKQEGADIVCFMDADCLPEPNWVSRMEAAQRVKPGIVSGRTFSDNAGTAVGLFHDVCGTLNGRVSEDGNMLYGCTCNLSISVAVVDLEFDESFSAASFEDVEFCVRAGKLGITRHMTNMQWYFTTTNRACVDCSAHTAAWCRQFKRYGQFEPQMCAKHPEYQAWLWASSEISSYDVDELQRLPPRRPHLGPTLAMPCQ